MQEHPRAQCHASSMATRSARRFAGMAMFVPALAVSFLLAPISQSLAQPASSGSQIVLNQEKRTESVPFRTIMRMSQSIPAGTTQVVQEGKTGTIVKTYRVTYKNDVPVHWDVIDQTVTSEPRVRIIACGVKRVARALPSRSGTYSRIREFDMQATGYSPYEGSGAGRCKNGMRAGYGIVAVDPRVIPLGSRLYIDGYGYALAGDTGSAIRGNRIDLGHETYREAANVGRRKVHVYLLSSER